LFKAREIEPITGSYFVEVLGRDGKGAGNG
jgi:hypothetical protein